MGTDNASITHIVSTEDRWIVRGYNDIAHLERGFRSPQAQPE
jgi:2,3-bisphosphoglycerate-dependent phosphoglycerate mutase